MATISIYLDTRYAGGNDSPVKAVIRKNKQSAMLPLGIKVKPNHWDDSAKAVKPAHPNARYINTFILGKKYALEAELLKMETTDSLHGMSASEIRDALASVLNPERKPKECKNSFLARYERFMGLKTKFKTIEGYRWTLNKLKEFDPHLAERSFEDITVDYINDFNAHFDCAVNTKNVSLRYIRAVFRDAIKAKVTTHYPFAEISLKGQKTRKKALSPEKMRELIRFECKETQKEYRDIFVLSFLLRGINIGDLLQATDENIVNGRFEYRRSKVGTPFSIKLEPEALDIIGRYKGRRYLLCPLDRYKNYRDYLHHMNDGLKNIGKDVGKHGKWIGGGAFPGLSTNWARHTWATTGLNLDIPVEVISRGMGHSGALSVTQIYMDFDMKKVDKANRDIIDYVFYGKKPKKW